jgi:ABC-type Fe3+/spermidine/putrescine transport system ATPase subunit
MIRIEGLEVRTGDFLLHIDDLSLENSEFLVILGPTGAGKTVLLETVAGLRRPIKGRLWLGGREVTHEPPERRHAGFVYQDYALFPHLSVSSNIAFGLRHTRKDRRAQGGGGHPEGRCHGGFRGHEKDGRHGRNAKKADRVRELATLLSIEHLLERYPEGLSGGEQQRVALARALAVEPDVLLLDEPLSALDRQTRGELRGELKRLQRESGVTVMHVTHDLDEALALGSTMAVLVDGRLLQVGAPGDVVRFPSDVQVARLLGLTNVFPARRGDAQGRDPRQERWRVRLEGGREILTDTVRPGVSLEPFHVVIRPEEIMLLAFGESPAGPAASLGSPTENLLEGIIRDIQIRSVHASVKVEVPPMFTVHVLRPQVERMKLEVGSRVALWIPPPVVHIC